MLLWLYCLFVLVLNGSHSQYIYRSSIVSSGLGSEFYPANRRAQLITTVSAPSWNLCAVQCSQNTFCRVYQYGSTQANDCLLFEGDINILGSIVPSSVAYSRVGIVEIKPSLFTQHGKPCTTVCVQSRYLQCNANSTCECMPHTYWSNLSQMCLAQMTISGAFCNSSMNMCRGDLNLTCSSNNECIDTTGSSWPTGIPIANSSTTVQGSGSVGLGYPMGVKIYDANGNESIMAVDSTNYQIIYVENSLSSSRSVSVLFESWSGDGLRNPSNLFLDSNQPNNSYVVDCNNQRIVLFFAMQTSSPLPQTLAGIEGSYGSSLQQLNFPYGMSVDQKKNLYIADSGNNRIMLWPANATSGTMIIGSGTAGSNSTELNDPYAVFLDESKAILYVADMNNHRIQSYNISGNIPLSGVTVAGGNGAGCGSNQLNLPTDLWISTQTGAMYIVDSGNNRVQRWILGASSGVTVVGDPACSSGSDSKRLSNPFGIAVRNDETGLYVSEIGNTRIQYFPLT